MKLLTILLNILLLILSIDCHYTSIKIKRNLLESNLNLSTFLQNETFYSTEENKTNNSKNLMEPENENNPIFTKIDLINYKDVQYSGDIYVGTPYKKFSVIYDTGSNLFWLPSINCTLKCRNDTNRYNPELSSTSQNMHIKKNISYAKGYIKGRLYKEKVCLNKKSAFSFLYNKELSVDNYKLIAVYKEKYLFKTIFDGIVGLGINDEGYINNSLIKLLYEQNKISKPSFSFYLFSNNNTNDISRLYIGDILENDYIYNLFKDKINYCYLPDNNEYWFCQSNTLKFELKENNTNSNSSKTKVVTSKSGVIFDTGTSFTIIPKNDSQYIMDYFNNTLGKNCFITKYQQIFCECNSDKEFGNIKIYFDENNYYQINFEDLIKYNKSFRYQCHFQMLVNKIDFGSWVIGDSSLRSSLITFNMQERKISFIQNINNIIEDNKIAKSILINQSWISNSLFWILIIGGILLIIILIIYIFK